MTLLTVLKNKNWGGGSSALPFIFSTQLRKKKKKKKTALQKLDDIFGTQKSGTLELMDDDYNQKLKLILITALMEDDD